MQNSTTEKFSEPHLLSNRYWAATLESFFQGPVADIVLTPLAGDASTRKYFRLSYQKGCEDAGKQSVILMQLEKPQPEKDVNFISLTKFLRGLGLPAPQLFYYDVAKGFLFLEDCGDTLLQDLVLSNPDVAGKRTWYRKAVKLLAELQLRATQRVGPDCPAFHARFDVEKLMWEFDFMLTHYVEGLKKHSLPAEDSANIRRCFEPLCITLAGQQLYFTHRDYHSRNLMVLNDELKILDYQDARMGPCQYDLVSLLRDSYVVLEEELVREMVELFIGLKEDAEGRKVDRDDFYRLFDLMSIQRNLKAVGTFAFQKVRYGNDFYLQYIPPTLAYVKRALDRHPELSDFREELARYIPEIKADLEKG